jgi:hypothetical protein
MLKLIPLVHTNKSASFINEAPEHTTLQRRSKDLQNALAQYINVYTQYINGIEADSQTTTSKFYLNSYNRQYKKIKSLLKDLQKSR